MGVWDHVYYNSEILEQISTHYVNLPHLWCAQNEFNVAIDQQHTAIRWFDLEEVCQSEGHHTYMNQYAGWILDHLLRKEAN